MINNQSTAIISAIKLYGDEGGGNDLINDICMINGRIIGHVKPSEEQHILSLKTAKEQLLEICPEISISAKTTISEYLVNLIKATATAQTQDLQIKKALEKLKDKYKEKFEYINKITGTNYDKDYEICSTSTLNKYCEEIGISRFGNKFTKDVWVFKYNIKHEKMDKNAFYMSNIIALQYETVFKENKWFMVLPKTIVRSNITNSHTNSVLEAHCGNYDSDEFMKEFLTTVNGKSTQMIAKDFGLKIDRLTVEESGEEVVVKQETRKLLNVICHVRPDPEVYGNSSEVD